MIRQLAKITLIATTIICLAIISYVVFYEWRHGVYETPRYDQKPPLLPESGSAPHILLFSKTNGFRHIDAIPAANALFQHFANQQGWSIFTTENAAIHNEKQLAKFDLIIWNNVSGDVLLPEQRSALQNYLTGGGKLLAIHASGGDPVYAWQWYPAEVIRAQFIGHPLFPQLQTATLIVEDRNHPSTSHLLEEWQLKDEWYSFSQSPRNQTHVLLSVDENSYYTGINLTMGKDHPLVWYHRLGKGTVYYTAIGHRAETYQDPDYQKLLLNSARWLLEQ